MAGILPRYIADFGPFISLSTIIVILSLLKKYHNIHLKKVLTTFLMLSITFNLILYFNSEHLLSGNNILFIKLYYLFNFYL